MTKFGVSLPWAGMRNAELEVARRLQKAARNVGFEIVILDSDGYVFSEDFTQLSSSTGTDDLLFVIALHFESPRLFSGESFYPLWQPIQFYVDFGYQSSLEKAMSHSWVLSCGSQLALEHANSWLVRRPLQSDSGLHLFHSPAQPYLPTKVCEQSRVAYLGVNWERLTGRGGRFESIFRLLDERPWFDVYGPETILDRAPWEGYGSYRGEIPFDGQSVLSTLQRAGICFAPSSKEHTETAILSNRIFESIGAGAVVITNPHPLVERWFSDVVEVVDTSQPAASAVHQIEQIVANVRLNPQRYREMVDEAQTRLTAHFSLERSLTEIAAFVADLHRGKPRTIELLEGDDGAREPKWCIVVCTTSATEPADLRETIDSVRRAFGDRPFGLAKWDDQCSDSELKTVDISVTSSESELSWGEHNQAVCSLDRLSAEYDLIAFLSAGEFWLDDHVWRMENALADDPLSIWAESGMIVQYEDFEDGVLRKRRLLKDLSSIHSGPGDARPMASRTFRGSFVAARPKVIGSKAGWREVYEILVAAAVRRSQPRYTFMATAGAALTPKLPMFAGYGSKLRSFLAADAFHTWSALHDYPLSSKSPTFENLSSQSRRRTLIDDVLWMSGDRIDFSRLNKEKRKVTGTGLAEPEVGFTWVDGRFLLLYLPPFLGAWENASMFLEVEIESREDLSTVQSVSFAVNGDVVSTHSVRQRSTIRVPVPNPNFAADNILEMSIKHATPITKRGKVIDGRHLGVRLFSVSLTEDEHELVDVCVPNNQAAGKQLDAGNVHLVSGFSKPEESGVWIDGHRARLCVDTQENDAICLGLRSREFRAGVPTKNQVSVVVGGIARQFLLDSRSVVQAIVQVPRNERVEFILEVKKAAPVLNSSGNCLDARRLGVQLVSVSGGPGKPVQGSAKVMRWLQKYY